MLTDRQKNLLKEVVENYIADAQPVGSKLLSNKFVVSSATIRNEMGELEKQGLIYQPHTSAGRVPSESGYKFYLENFVKKDRELPVKYKEILDDIIDRGVLDYEQLVKRLAKALAEISHNAVMVGFGPNDVFYTGLANLFAQPEFSQIDLVVTMAQVVDHLDEVMNNIFHQVDQPEARVGQENPFGLDCSSVLSSFKKGDEQGLIGILGPMRMDYQKNFSLLNYVNSLIAKV